MVGINKELAPLKPSDLLSRRETYLQRARAVELQLGMVLMVLTIYSYMRDSDLTLYGAAGTLLLFFSAYISQIKLQQIEKSKNQPPVGSL